LSGAHNDKVRLSNYPAREINIPKKVFKQKLKIPTTMKRLSLVTLLAVVTMASFVMVFSRDNNALAATSNTINFQARLLTAAGAVVPDGNYNVEFKLYTSLSSSGSSQGSCTGDSACVWVETRTSGNTVRVVNGYLTVNLGSVNAFGSINWDQQLWLGMNIGGTSVSPSWDGEMSPRLQLTAVPYAFRAGTLVGGSGSNITILDGGTPSGSNTIHLPAESGTLCIQSSVNCGFAISTGSSNYIQNTTTVQANANFNIRSNSTSSATGVLQGASGQTADLFDAQTWNGTTATTVFSINNVGAMTLSGTGTATFTTPQGSNIQTKISIPTYDPGAFGQILAMGLPATANSSARVMSLLDARTTAHQPTIAVFNPGEGDAIGFDWNGTSNLANVQTIDLSAGGSTDSVMVRSGNVGSGNGGSGTAYLESGSIAGGSGGFASGNVVLQSGNAAGTTAVSGNVQIDVGTATGTKGTISIGSTTSPTINIGNSGSTTAVTGILNQSGGTVSLAATGNASYTASGTLTITAGGGSTWSTSSGNLTVQAATTSTLALQTGGAGTVSLGDQNTTTINIGRGSNIARTISIGTAGTSTAQAITIGSTGGTSTTTIQGGTGAGAIALTAGTNGAIGITASGTGNITLSGAASIINKTSTNSTTGFQIQNQSSAAILTGDTTNAAIDINGAPSTGTLNNIGGFTVAALSAPATITITQGGTAGAASYTYNVYACDDTSCVYYSAPGTKTTTTGNATLSGTNFNTITWTAVNGARQYMVYRTAGAGSPMYIGITSSLTMNDTGSGFGFTAPTTGTSGSIVASGSASIGANITVAGSTTTGTLSVTGNGTVNGIMNVGGSTTLTNGAPSDLEVLGGIQVANLSVPGAPSVTTHGTTGATNYTYYVAACSTYCGNYFGFYGQTTAASTGTSISNGNATLNTTNYNQVGWSTVQGAAGYVIYRTSGASTTLVAIAAAGSTSYNDTGSTLGAATIPSVDQTGNIQASTGQFSTLDTAIAGTLNIGTNNATAIALQKATAVTGNLTQSGGLVTLTATGNISLISSASTIAKSSTNSATAFQVQNATAGVVLDADTSNTRIGIGTAAPAYTLDVAGDTNIGSGNAYRIGGTSICTSAGCTAASGSTYYIQNQFSTVQSANIRVQSTSDTQNTLTIESTANQNNGTINQSDLLEFQNSSGSMIAGVTPIGTIWSAPVANLAGVPLTARMFIQANSTSSNSVLIRTSASGTGISTDAAPLRVQNKDGSIDTFVVGGDGSALHRSLTNSTTAFRIQNSSAGTDLNVDTVSDVTTISTTNATAPHTALVVNSGSSGYSGMQFTQLNSSSSTSSTYSQLLGVDSSGNVGLSSAGVSLTSPALAYWDGLNDPTVTGNSYPQATVQSLGTTTYTPNYSGTTNGEQLTNQTANETGDINWNFSQVPFEETQFQFMASPGGASPNGADGTWFYSYADGVPTSEFGGGGSFTKGYIIYFSEYHGCAGITYGTFTDGNQCNNGGGTSGAGTSPLISTNLGSAAIANAAFHSVDVMILDNKITVRLDGKVILQYSDIYTRDTSHLNYGFGARTGAQYDNHYIKGLLVTKLGTNASEYNINNITPLTNNTSNTSNNMYWSNSAGALGINTYNPAAQLEVNTSTTSSIGAIIQGIASQSGDMLEIQNSSNAVLDKIDSSGNLTVTGTIAATSASTGANLTVVGGAATGTNAAGGNLLLEGGAATGTGTYGGVIAQQVGTNSDIFDVDGSGGSADKIIQVAATAANAASITLQALGSSSSDTVNIQAPSAASINIGTNAATPVNIGSTGSSANASVIQIADSTGANETVTIGSTNGTSTTKIQGGSGSVSLLSAKVLVGTGGGGAGSTTPDYLVLDDGTANPASPSTEGAMFYNSSLAGFECEINNIWQGCNGLEFVQTSQSANNTATTEGGAGSNFGQTYTVPAGDCAAGVMYQITASGYFIMSSSATQLLFGLEENGVNLLSNGGTIGSTTLTATNTAGTAYEWMLNATITCYSATTVMVNTTVQYGTNGTTTTDVGYGAPDTSPLAWTNNATLQVLGWWNNNTSATLKMNQFSVVRYVQ
jgi:hypothetical protein